MRAHVIALLAYGRPCEGDPKSQYRARAGGATRLSTRPGPTQLFAWRPGLVARMHRATRLLAAALLAAVALLAATPAADALEGPPDQVGQGGPVLNWGVMGKHMVLLPTGNVLVWATGDTASLWNPGTGTVSPMHAPFGDIHCAAQVTLADGRVLVVGGQNGATHVGINVTSNFNPFTNAWTAAALMANTRWYPTATTLQDGRVLVASGDNASGVRVTVPELYDPVANAWKPLAAKSQGLYPFMYLVPNGNGKVYYAAPSTPTAFIDATGSGTWSAGPTSGYATSGYSESGA